MTSQVIFIQGFATHTQVLHLLNYLKKHMDVQGKPKIFIQDQSCVVIFKK